jgi:DNA-binding GntR family transcriptional regulator
MRGTGDPVTDATQEEPSAVLPEEALLHYQSKTDLVAALIREMIITGRLPAGKQLRQRDLAAQFRVSQTPVREAMRRLESEGLVAGDAHRGFTVTEADVGATEENFRIRAVLESLAASMAADSMAATGTGEEGVRRLIGLNDQMRDVAEGDQHRYAELNRDFHFLLYEYAHSPLLLSLMRLLWQALHGGPRVLRTHAESAMQHDEIIDALRRGDSDAAAKATYEHIMGAPRAD